MKNRFFVLALAFFNLLAWPGFVTAGFLEMPEITQMPQLERKSMLKDLDIPSVRERDPDPGSGPRLNVLKFKLEGIVEYPELGITQQDIETLIESIRSELMQDYSVMDSGFTQKELEEVSRLLVDIEEQTMDRHVSELEVQKLIWLVREQRSNRGITLGTIETVADRITQFYRERGFILAKAYIPQQQVRDGIVTLTLLLGMLGDVSVSGAKLYDEKYLAEVFEDALSKPVTSAVVEENLYLINDYPGLQVTGFFQPGQQVGDTRLNIDVKVEQPYDVNIRVDNHGSEQTGEYRFYAEGYANNLFGKVDQLETSLLITARPENTVYGQLRYSTRLLSPRFNLSLGATNNDFVLGSGNSESVNDLNLEGSTEQLDLTATYRFKRSRAKNYYADFKYERVESKIRLGSLPGEGDVGLDDAIQNYVVDFRFDVLDEESKILHQGDIKLVSGKFDKGADEGQDKNYEYLKFDYSLLTFWQIPYFETNTRLIYRTSLQYTGSPLSSISQFSLAGPARAKAYPVNQFSADSAIYLGVDWIFDSLEILDIEVGQSNLKNMISPFIFVDATWGEGLSLLDIEEDRTGQLVDAGFGFQFSYKSDISGNVLLAFPVKESFSSEDTSIPSDNFKLVFDFQYSFL